MRVLICGGGALGAAVAYFLALRGAEPVLIERAGLANAASGKSGGFLALDWCDGGALEPLARRSFALHAELAESLGNPWGYRAMETLQVLCSARRRFGGGDGAAEKPAWLSEETLVYGHLGSAATTAQVEPAAFTRGLAEAAVARGARVQTGRVTGIGLAAAGARVTGVQVEDEVLQADAVVLAMGPWTALASRWLPLPAVYGLKGHSLVFGYRPPGGPHALFVEYEAEDGGRDSPEVFPRADGTTYICGLSSEAPLPLDPAAVGPDPGAHEKLRAAAARLAPALGEAEVLASGACYRPVTADGLPLLGAIAGVEGAYLATGHSVWGMLNAPASGEALAGLIAEGESPRVDLAPYDPARLPPLDPSALGA